jgi:hypothetical protein
MFPLPPPVVLAILADESLRRAPPAGGVRISGLASPLRVRRGSVMSLLMLTLAALHARQLILAGSLEAEVSAGCDAGLDADAASSEGLNGDIVDESVAESSEQLRRASCSLQ